MGTSNSFYVGRNGQQARSCYTKLKYQHSVSMNINERLILILSVPSTLVRSSSSRRVPFISEYSSLPGTSSSGVLTFVCVQY